TSIRSPRSFSQAAQSQLPQPLLAAEPLRCLRRRSSLSAGLARTREAEDSAGIRLPGHGCSPPLPAAALSSGRRRRRQDDPPVQVSPLIKFTRYSALLVGMIYGKKRYDYLKPIAEEERRIEAEEKKKREELERIAKELAEASEDSILK
ncbi:ATP synthase subunit e, mitochondrial, partial [Corvus cornix cornix]|uniref:ATP synthase subunit e, mitochondrial n=1 Tax=Corvus cornix cornix TaxID=932674 RepID=UPI00194F561C